MSENRTARKKEAEEHRRDIETYLLAEVRKGRYYFKAYEVAEVTGLSPHTAGSNIAMLKKVSSHLTIIHWSSSTSTVWKITEKTEKTGKTEPAVECS